MLNVPIAVKKALKEGTHKKNYRFVVLNDDGTADFTIDNDTLVAESVMIDERMATGSELKFGLCEGSSLEFQYFDHDNIRGRQLQVFIDVEYGEEEPYPIPMGFFTVKSCSMQFSTGIFKATAYNKLQSDYLDSQVAVYLDSIYSDTTTFMLYDIRCLLLEDYEIDYEEDYEIVPVVAPSAWDNKVKCAGASSLTYKAKYGIDAHFNYYDAGYSGNINNIWVQASRRVYKADILPDKYYKIKFSNNEKRIDRFEELLCEKIKYLVAGGCTQNPDTFLNSMIRYTSSSSSQGGAYQAYLGWHSICSIRLTKADDTVEYYSTVAKENGRNVAGKFSDIIDTIITGYKMIELIIPRYIENVITYEETSQAYIYGCNTLYPFLGQDHTYHYRLVPPSGSVPWEPPSEIGTGIDPGMKWDDGSYIEFEDLKYTVREITNLNSADKVQLTLADLGDMTMRDAISASYESVCQFGQLDRVTDLFSGVELNGGGLYPSETLYPADGLYPNANTGGQGFHPYPSEYSKLWTDTQGEQSFRYLIITYKGLDENNQEVEKTLQRTVNADGTTDYNMSDNWLFRNLVWADADVGDYADAMVTKMQDIRWFPFEMWAAGLPYVETGDAIEITDRNGGSHVSYVLQRQLQGIQNLQDTYVNGELDIF